MPLRNIMPFVTSSKEVIRLSITTTLRESKGKMCIRDSRVSDRAEDDTYIDATDKVVSILRFCKEAKFRKEIFEMCIRDSPLPHKAT